MRDDVIICRCEEVTYGELKQAMQAGLIDAGDLRKYARVGMGYCQGRTCQRLLMQTIRQYCREHNLPVPKDDVHPRTPAQALTVEAIAKAE